MSDPAAHLNRLRNELDSAFQDWNDFETDLLDHHAIRLKDRDENWESRLTELEGSIRDASQVHSAINVEIYRLEQAEKASPNAQLPPLTGADALPEELRAGSLPFRPLTIDDVHNFDSPMTIGTTFYPGDTEALLGQAPSGRRKSQLIIFGAVGLAILGAGYFALRPSDKSVSPVPVTVVDSVALPSSTLAEVLPVLPQAATAAAAGYSCVGDQFQLFDSSNVFLVSGGGGTPPTFSTGGKPYCLASVSTYHWNDGAGAAPGKVGLRGTQEMVGPAQAQGTSGQGGAQNVNWVYVPASDAIPLLNGQYSCTDSDSATWSQNNESVGQGFCRVWVQTAEKLN